MENQGDGGDAWPRGLQEEFSAPVTLLIDEGPKVHALANEHGYRCFSSVDSFKHYVTREILAMGETLQEVEA